ncbi:MAG: ParB N-terminal domain-containing protein, partial [Pseudomonadota bacterium]
MALDRLPLSEIEPNPKQPRKLFRKDKLEELAASIEEHGLLEPIVVARRGRKWQIIMGERRWRA